MKHFTAVLQANAVALILLSAVSCVSVDVPETGVIDSPGGELTYLDESAIQLTNQGVPDFTVRLTEEGLLMEGPAEFGNHLALLQPVEADGFEAYISLEYLVDNDEVDNWVSLGVVSRPGYISGDPNEGSGNGILFLFRRGGAEGDLTMGVEVMKNPGLEILGNIEISYVPSGIYRITLQAAEEGWIAEVNDQSTVISYDSISADHFRSNRAFFFLGSHADGNQNLKVKLRRINYQAFAQY